MVSKTRQKFVYKGPRPLRAARVKAGLTQAAAADLFDVSLNTWQVWERGRPDGPKPPRYWSVWMNFNVGARGEEKRSR